MSKPIRDQFEEATNDFFQDEDAKSNLFLNKLESISDTQAIEFAKWSYRRNWQYDEKMDCWYRIGDNDKSNEALIAQFKSEYYKLK